MLNEKARWSSVDALQIAPSPAANQTNRRRPEDEPTVEMTRAEVEEMLRNAPGPTEQN